MFMWSCSGEAKLSKKQKNKIDNLKLETRREQGVEKAEKLPTLHMISEVIWNELGGFVFL